MRNEIGARIAKLRESKGLSQKQLAEALKVRRETVTQWENATRDLKTEYLVKLAQYFNVSVDYLLFLSDAPSRNEDIQGLHSKTGLWDGAITQLIVDKYIDDTERAEFASYLIQHECFPKLIKSIKQYHSFSPDQTCYIDIHGDDHETSMQALFKLIVSDLFWGIANDFTVKPGQIMIDRKTGESNG